MDPFFIEFEVNDKARFDQMQTIFAALQQAKRSDEFSEDQAFWLRFFDAAARSYFWWPTQAEHEEHMARWFATPVPQRWSDPSLQHGWMFGAMIDAFRNGEYDLVSCRLVQGNRARIEYEPSADPFGGTGCMKALVECFGFKVTGEDTDD